MEPRLALQNTYENSEFLSICLLNIISLRKDSIDLKFDPTIFSSDVLALTENHLKVKPHDFDSEIKENLHPFQLHRQDNFDKYSSLAICFRNSVETSDYQYFCSLNALKFVITSNSSKEKDHLFCFIMGHSVQCYPEFHNQSLLY